MCTSHVVSSLFGVGEKLPPIENHRVDDDREVDGCLRLLSFTLDDISAHERQIQKENHLVSTMRNNGSLALALRQRCLMLGMIKLSDRTCRRTNAVFSLRFCGCLRKNTFLRV